ncbi:Retrovirus-related Pol poly from transposon [Paramuricea clavata]|uniref:Retrovirus-related Pol poly from transposon n=1 Tax=Paramuricea clavata TaxID=317549 RepID=A0A7D9IXW8_PARCT|nr:Retrovirus-related Pol poly from transposon [Paramuricea clavata]
MAYFDPTNPTKVLVDASPTGLGAILMQDGKVISYGSRVLTDVESRYSQTEREMLAVVWATEHYHLYLYSAKPGKDDANPADFISRHRDKATPFPDNIAETYVNYLSNNIIPKAMTLSEVQKETKNDSTLQKLSQAVETNHWSDPEIQMYTDLKDELSVCDGLIIRGTRLVLPKSSQHQAIELVQTGHQGIVNIKRLLREKVWFPSIDRMVQERIKNCIPCQAATQGTMPKPEPLNMTPLPKAPCCEIAIDFVGPFPSGEVLLVVIDEFSRFPQVKILHSTTANAVIPKLDCIFSRRNTQSRQIGQWAPLQ